MINFNYTFPIKATGPANCIHDGEYYGNDDFTWNFEIHAPVMTSAFVQKHTGINIVTESGGSTEKAEATLLKVARIANTRIMSFIPNQKDKKIAEFRVAKDNDVLYEHLFFQLEIIQTWGGYNSLYRVTDLQNQQSIGKAAEDYLQASTLINVRYRFKFDFDETLFRSDY